MTSVSITNEEFKVCEVPAVHNFMISGQLTDIERKCLNIQAPEELAKSKYDLPVEFHRKRYEEWLHKSDKDFGHKIIQAFMGDKTHHNFYKYLLSQKTSIMYLCETRKPNRSSRFEHMNPQYLMNTLDQRPRFLAVRNMAIHLLRSSTLFELNTIAFVETCPSIDQIPLKLFSWSADDYYQRRDLVNTLWLDVFEKDYKNCLNVMKIKSDLQELCRFLNLIFCGALCIESDFSFDNDVLQPLEDASDLLSVYERLQTELFENRNHVVDLREQYALSVQAVPANEEENSESIMQQIADSNMIQPIQFRYQKGWYDAQVDQVEMHNDFEAKVLENKLADWKQKALEENNALKNSLTMYYTELDYFKGKIAEFLTKFEIEYEDLDNAINYKRMSMEKMDSQRKYCDEQIHVMRDKIEDYHLKIRLAKEEKIRLAIERAEAALLQATKQSQKKRQKDQKQKGKNKK